MRLPDRYEFYGNPDCSVNIPLDAAKQQGQSCVLKYNDIPYLPHISGQDEIPDFATEGSDHGLL